MTGGAGRVRIVGGILRRTPLQVASDVAAIRPTPDRVRETLFNWLGDRVVGAHCLDLFAGTGALGFEAASRGAGGIHLHDTQARVGQLLRAQIDGFARATDPAVQALAARLHYRAMDALDALAWHAQCGRRFDLVFLDPPFAQHWLSRLAAPLARLLLTRCPHLL